jgi:transcriptional regulator with XRE-family HTH domain
MKTDIHNKNIVSLNHLRKHAGKQLREKRLEKNYSLHAMAADLGMSKGTLSQIENGTYNFNMEMIGKVADCYDISIDELITQSPKKMV